jgi:hypothetical protein
MSKESSEIVLGKIVEKRIFLIRGHRVMLDSDLAPLVHDEPPDFEQTHPHRSREVLV